MVYIERIAFKFYSSFYWLNIVAKYFVFFLDVIDSISLCEVLSYHKSEMLKQTIASVSSKVTDVLSTNEVCSLEDCPCLI